MLLFHIQFLKPYAVPFLLSLSVCQSLPKISLDNYSALPVDEGDEDRQAGIDEDDGEGSDLELELELGDHPDVDHGEAHTHTHTSACDLCLCVCVIRERVFYMCRGEE